MAKEKSTKKKAAPKEKKARAATKYELTASGKKVNLDELGPQQKLVFAELNKGPRSTAEIADAIAGKIETKQTPQRVAGFYISQAKKDSHVKAAKVAA